MPHTQVLPLECSKDFHPQYHLLGRTEDSCSNEDTAYILQSEAAADQNTVNSYFPYDCSGGSDKTASQELKKQ